MNKNKFIYILVMVIALFGFKSNVYAAQELTCVYKIGFFADKVLLVQYSSGEIEVYKNSKDETLSGNNWYAFDNYTYDDSVSDITENGHLKSCPKTKKTAVSGKVTFYGGTGGDTDLVIGETNEEKAIAPVEVKSEVSDNSGFASNKCETFTTEQKWLSDLNKDTYAGSCLYEKNFGDGCHIIQLDIGTKDILVTESNRSSNPTERFNAPKLDKETLNPESILDTYGPNCPIELTVTTTLASGTKVTSTYNTKIGIDLKGGDSYKFIASRGKSLDGSELNEEIDIKLNFIEQEIKNCEDILGEDDVLKDMLKTAISIVRIAVPIVLIALGSLDFAQAVFSSSEDKIRKVQSKFIKRILIAVAIFLIPSVLKLLLGIADGIWGNIDVDLCGLL